MRKVSPVFEAVRCNGEGCEKILDANSKDYYTIYGNITLGLETEIVGSNINENEAITGASVYCKKCAVNLFLKKKVKVDKVEEKVA